MGVVGVIGVRSAQESSADAQKSSSQTVAPAGSEVQEATVTTSNGLTRADLDVYAVQLEQERVKLEKYRAKLVLAAQALKQAGVGQPAPTSKKKPSKVPTKPRVTKTKVTKLQVATPQGVKPQVATPADRPVAVDPPVQRPQSNTRSS